MRMDLSNQFLVGLGSEQIQQYKRSVIFVCQHNENGAMGLIINHQSKIKSDQLFKRYIDDDKKMAPEAKISEGGPVETDSGFVIHSNDQTWDSSINVGDVSVSTSQAMMRAMARKEGPEHSLIVLGYCGWNPGQLEEQVRDGLWLTCDINQDVLFNTPFEERWEEAIHSVGIEPYQLTQMSGHA